ncbi:hypothetical protein ZOSMA_383G00010 [Zostera marina]|uniref:Uncharacterized protein n=1 Tax=Zostera marina TaxID=29655 RepID=A0A0K9P787_ZOSMR|nr:hypothetical protein ZOSMA_383G00010 [Zostera marina]
MVRSPVQRHPSTPSGRRATTVHAPVPVHIPACSTTTVLWIRRNMGNPALRSILIPTIPRYQKNTFIIPSTGSTDTTRYGHLRFTFHPVADHTALTNITFIFRSTGSIIRQANNSLFKRYCRSTKVIFPDKEHPNIIED